MSDLLRTLPKAKQLVERIKTRRGTDEKIADEKQGNDSMLDSVSHEQSDLPIPYISHE